MNSNVDDPGGGQDTGRPIRLLLEQERPVPPDFLVKVRGRIHRRTTAAQLASYSWNLPKAVLVEMANLLKHLFSSMSARKDSQP